MIFEWDEIKAEENARKHGVPFPYATRVFLDERRIELRDSRRDYGEQRWITLGRIEGRVFVVAFTLREDAIRLISARKANPREQGYYDETLST